jgi:hypothetical protein
VSSAFAQLVGTRDLSRPSSPVAKTNLPAKEDEYCIPPGGVSDGFDVHYPHAKLKLTIPRAEMSVVNGELGVLATLRLKNDGDKPTTIPWSPSRVESVHISEDGQSKTLGYEVATIDFFFGRPHTKTPGLTIQGEAALWSQPDNSSQHITLRPREWVEVKFRPTVRCSEGDAASCLSRLQRDKVRFSAWWYQRLLTTTMHGDCIFANGAYTQYEIDSEVVRASSARH